MPEKNNMMNKKMSEMMSKMGGKMRDDSTGMKKLPNRKKKNAYVMEALDGKGGCKKK